MAAFTETGEGLPRGLGLLEVDGNELDSRPSDEAVQIPEAFAAVPRVHDNGDLDKCRNRHAARICRLDGLNEAPAFGFAL
jgi:hypothetical protein